MKSLRECVSLLLSECRHSFQELKDSLGRAKLRTGEDNRMDFTQNKQQQQLEKQQQMSKKISLTKLTLTQNKEMLQHRGSLTSFPEEEKEKNKKTKEARSSLGTNQLQ